METTRWKFESNSFRYREEKVYTTTVEALPFFFFWVWGSMVYTLLSGPMVYTCFPCFPRKMVCTIAFFCSVTSGSGDRPKKEGCHGGGVYSYFPDNMLRKQGEPRKPGDEISENNPWSKQPTYRVPKLNSNMVQECAILGSRISTPPKGLSKFKKALYFKAFWLTKLRKPYKTRVFWTCRGLLGCRGPVEVFGWVRKILDPNRAQIAQKPITGPFWGKEERRAHYTRHQSLIQRNAAGPQIRTQKWHFRWLKTYFSGSRWKWLKNDSQTDFSLGKSQILSHFWVTFSWALKSHVWVTFGSLQLFCDSWSCGPIGRSQI